MGGKTRNIIIIVLSVLCICSIAAVIAMAVLYTNALSSVQGNQTITSTTDAPATSTAPPATSRAEISTTLSDAATTTMAAPVSSTLSPVENEFKRINCVPEKQGTADVPWDITEEFCDNRGCTYDDSTTNLKVPICYMHPEKIGYKVTEVNTDDPDWYIILKLEALSTKSVFDTQISTLEFKAKIWNNQHLQITIDAPSSTRYRVPFTSTMTKQPDADASTADYEVTYESEPFSFAIKRRSTNTILFDTSIGGLVFEDRFLQIATTLPSDNLYGIGEHEHPSLRHDLDYRTWPIFARDQGGLGEGANLYGTHPFYMVLENDGNSHGVFLLNSNAMEFSLIPAPGLIMRTIGGVLDLHFSTGPHPQQVIQQHTDMVGHPFIPPYWSLGFHLCRYGYNTLENMQAAVNRTRNAGIPLDVIYADIDHMDERKDFTIDKTNFKDLPNYFKNERDNNGLRSVIILDPAIMEDSNYEPWTKFNDAYGWITWENGTTMMGYVWPPGFVAFPDFFLQRTKDAWNDLIVQHHQILDTDGFWIDMNEPANFGTNDPNGPFNNPGGESLMCPDSYYDSPPYTSHATLFHGDVKLSDKTICMEARQNDGAYRHYDVHNLYGYTQSIATVEAARNARPGKRGFVLSRSTFAGSGTMVAHWSGDNLATWAHLHRSLVVMLEMSMFGLAFTGPDICGFMKVSDPPQAEPELCLRWSQLGAFYPYSRNHNDLRSPDQDPAALGPEVAAEAKRYMDIRYKFLPYMYTLFYHANQDGYTVARPLFFEFPNDDSAKAIDTEFMLGPAILISPLLDEGASEHTGYVPQGAWFSYAKMQEFIDSCTGGADKTFTLNGTAMLLRGGSVIPTQSIETSKYVTTTAIRNNPFTLNVVFECSSTINSTGSLFWDDGESIDTVGNGEYFYAEYESSVTSDSVSFSSTVKHTSGISAPLGYETINFYGSDLKEVTTSDVVCKTNPGSSCPGIVCEPFDSTLKHLDCNFDSLMPLDNEFTIMMNF